MIKEARIKEKEELEDCSVPVILPIEVAVGNGGEGSTMAALLTSKLHPGKVKRKGPLCYRCSPSEQQRKPLAVSAA